jgi:hypothetical protein
LIVLKIYGKYSQWGGAVMVIRIRGDKKLTEENRKKFLAVSNLYVKLSDPLVW